MERDFELMQWLDRLDYAEAWLVFADGGRQCTLRRAMAAAAESRARSDSAEATERVLARYSKGTQEERPPQPERGPQQRRPLQRQDVRGGPQPQDRLAASAAHRA